MMLWSTVFISSYTYSSDNLDTQPFLSFKSFSTDVGVCSVAKFVILSCTLIALMTLSVQPAVAQSDTKQQRETEEYLSQPLETADTTGGNLLSTDQTEGLNEQVDETDSSISWFIVKSILALGVVSIAIWGVSKLIQKSGFGSSDGDLMNIRSTLPVGQNQYLQIVQVGKQFFMLGVTKKNINMLGELDDSETIRSLQLQDETQQTDASSQQNGFSELLNRMIGTNDHDFSDQGSDSNQDPFDQIQQKMDQLRQSESTR